MVNKPGKVPNVFIQETYSVSVAREISMLPKSHLVLPSRKGNLSHQSLIKSQLGHPRSYAPFLAIFPSSESPSTFHSEGFCICASIYLEYSASNLLVQNLGWISIISSERGFLFSPPSVIVIPVPVTLSRWTVLFSL